MQITFLFPAVNCVLYAACQPHCRKATVLPANLNAMPHREDDGLFLESDTDEQLLLNIHFNQKVRIHSITIKGPEEEGPKVVKLYTNRCAAGTHACSRLPATPAEPQQESGTVNSCSGMAARGAVAGRRASLKMPEAVPVSIERCNSFWHACYHTVAASQLCISNTTYVVCMLLVLAG